MSDKKAVHRVSYASQPNILIDCTQVWTQPSWASERVAEGVYQADNGLAYTFDGDKVTCEECLERAEAT